MDAIRFTQTGVSSFRSVGTLTVALALLLASIALRPMQAFAASQSRTENIATILKLTDVQTVIQKSQIASFEVARTRMNDVRVQLSGYMSSMNSEQKQRFDAAIERYITTVNTSYDSADAAAAWGRMFAANFTDRELSQAVEFSRTPLGGKLLKASVLAASQWNTEIRQARFKIADSAYTQMLAEVKALLNEITQSQTASALSDAAPGQEVAKRRPTICEVMSHPATYTGHFVDLSGRLVKQSGNFALIDDACLSNIMVLKNSGSLDKLGLTCKPNEPRVGLTCLFEGTTDPIVITASGMVSLANGGPFLSVWDVSNVTTVPVH